MKIQIATDNQKTGNVNHNHYNQVPLYTYHSSKICTYIFKLMMPHIVKDTNTHCCWVCQLVYLFGNLFNT